LTISRNSWLYFLTYFMLQESPWPG
jgi:hypothetical protein